MSCEGTDQTSFLKVTQRQIVQLLKTKILLLEDPIIQYIKVKWCQENYEDNCRFHIFPPSQTLKPHPKKSRYQMDIINFPEQIIAQQTL